MKFLAYTLILSLILFKATKESETGNQSFGVVDDSFEVNSMGAYNHIVPIHLPPGINNLAPSLAIAYDSRSGDSQFGKGWNLTGLSKIIRASKTFKHNGFSEGLTFTSSDNFLLDGQNLILIGGVNGRDRARYRTENENFFNIAAEGQLGNNSQASPKFFYIKQPNGLTYYYGDSDESVEKLNIDNRVEGLVWNVTRIEDQYGNYIVFEYELNTNSSRIKTIKYTGSKDKEPINEISFEYESVVGKKNIAIIKNNIVFDNQVIKWIQVSAHGERFKYYHFEWDKNHEKIVSIKECSDQSKNSCLNPTKITYNDYNAKASLFQKKEIKFDKLNGRSSNLYFEQDINNNGKVEYILLRGKRLPNNTESKKDFSLEVYKSPDYPSSSSDTLLIIKDFVTYAGDLPHTNYAIEFVDFTGDGLLDILSENTIWVNTSTRKKIEFTPILIAQPDAKNCISTYPKRIIIDLEGDGRNELLALNPSRQDHLLIRLGNNNTIEVKKYTNRTFTSPHKVSFDGVREQILLLQANPFSPASVNQRIVLNSWEKGLEITDWRQTIFGRSFLPAVATITADMINVSDVNFDGLTDLIIQPKNVATKSIVFWLNSGSPEFKDEDRYFGHTDFAYSRDVYVDLGGFTSSGALEILEIKKDTVTNFYIHTILFSNQLAISSLSKKVKLGSLPDLKWEKLNNTNIKIQLQDTNGDQYFDIRINNELNNSSPANNVFGRTEYLSQQVYPDLLESVVDGFGNIVKVEYAVTKGDPTVYTVTEEFVAELEHKTNYKVLHYPLTVVKRIAYSNGLENDSLNTSRYQYADLVIETKGRGLSGFRSVSKTDEANRIVTATTYEFEFPYAGKIKEQTKSISDNQIFYKQSNYWNTLNFKDGTSFTPTINLSEIQIIGKSHRSYMPVLDSTVVSNWELDGGLVSCSRLEYSYSSDGQIIKSVSNFQDGSKTTTEKTYEDYLDRPWMKSGIYMKGLIRSERIYTGNDISKARTVSYAYYTDKTKGEKGELKLKIRQPGNPQYEFKTAYQYDYFGNILEKNESGLITQYTYDALGQFMKTKEVQVSNNNVHITNYEFEPYYGNLVKETDPNGNWMKQSYDVFGKLQTTTHKDGRFEKYKFEYLSGLKDQVFDSGSTALYKLTTHSSGSNPVYQYFDQQGREVGSLYNLIDSTYVKEENLPQNKKKRTTINRYVIKLNTYDARGYLRKEYHPRYVQFITTDILTLNQGNSLALNTLNTSRCYKFEESGNGRYTTYTYDTFGRVIESETADGIKLKTEYRANKKIEYNGKGQKKITHYTTRSEIAAVHDDANSVLKYSYDDWGNLTQIAMPDGAAIQTDFDVLGRKIRLSDPNIGEIRYTYDVFDRLKSETTGSREVLLDYDLLGRMTRKITNKKDTLLWEYDTKKRGLLSSEIDIQKNKREYFYDTLARLTKIQHNLNGKSYFTAVEYDSLSRLRYKSYDSVYKIGYRYSNNIQTGIEQITASGNSPLFTVEAVNAYGNVTHKQYGNGIQTKLTYFTASGLLQEIRTQKKSISIIPSLQECPPLSNIDPMSISRDLLTQPRQIPFPINNPLNPFNPSDPFNPNNPQLPWTDPSRPKQLEALAFREKSTISVVDDNVIQHLSYRYDNNYNIALIDDIRNTTKKGFVYDNRNRLIKYENSNTALDPLILKYDQLGNIIYKSDAGTYEYGSIKNNQVSHIYLEGKIKHKYMYDTYGNITEDAISGLKISYTAFNKPLTLHQGIFRDSIWYGSDNAEVYRKKYLNDSTLSAEILRPFADMEIERKNNSELRLFYIRFGNDLIALREVNAVSTSPMPLVKLKFMHKDHLGSIDVITDELGNVIGKFEYSPFGERITTTGEKESVSRGFTGHKHYEAFGLVDAGGRYYIPAIGRFASADPFVQSPDNLQSLNRYSYVQNNPLNNIDPSGFFKIRIKNPLRAVGKLVKSVINAGRDVIQGVIDIHKNIYDEADRFVNKYGKQILIVAAAAAITYFSAGTLAGFGAAMLTGATWGAGISAGIAAVRGGNFQDILNAGFNGAIMGATAAAAAHSIGVGFKEAGIGNKFGSAGYYGKTAAHGISGGIQSEAAGGSFKNGLLSASISNAFTPVNERFFGSPTTQPDNVFQRIAFSSAVGGLAAHAGGGDALQGAMTAGFVQAFNHEGLFYMGSKTFSGLMGLKGLYDMNNYIESGDNIAGAGAALSLGGGLVRSIPHPVAQGIGWGMTGVGQAMVHREFLINAITPASGPAPYNNITQPASRNGRNW